MGTATSSAKADDGYKWGALANTTAAVFMSQVDGRATATSRL
jgi:hypothetical protein